MRLQGKMTFVTGAASGFGRGIAQRFIEEGAKVAVVDQNGDGARAVADELGHAAIALTCDVSKGDQMQASINTAIEAFGGLDIVVNNAGWTHKNQSLLDVDYETFKRVYEINVDSIFHSTKAIVPYWQKHGGGVMINVGSTAGIRPRPGLTWYNGTKGAVHLMTKSMAVELATDNIRVCAIAPVIGATGLLETFMGVADTTENRQKFLATIPLAALASPRILRMQPSILRLTTRPFSQALF